MTNSPRVFSECLCGLTGQEITSQIMCSEYFVRSFAGRLKGVWWNGRSDEDSMHVLVKICADGEG